MVKGDVGSTSDVPQIAADLSRRPTRSHAFPHETRALLVGFCLATVSLTDVNSELSNLGPGIPRDRGTTIRA
jgi:hypothetical protein